MQKTSTPYKGMNLDNTIPQKGEGVVSYALNAVVENSLNDGSIVYQNEPANIECCTLPTDFKLLGHKNILEEGYILVFLKNEKTGESEIGKITECSYNTYINANCLNFDLNHPIIDVVVKQTNCSVEVYFTDALNGRRYLDLTTPPYINDLPSNPIDCNKLLINPVFSIPSIEFVSITSGGDNQAGVYQFSAQYANALGEGYTSFYNVTNPIPLNENVITLDFNYIVDKTINLKIKNLDTSGYYDYVNVAVIKTINNVSTTELIGTYPITSNTLDISYFGQKQAIQLSLEDVITKFPIYENADGVYSTQDILGWYGVTTQERISYQEIANQINLQWQTYRIKGDAPYKGSKNFDLKGYFRDEIVPFEIVFYLTNGHQTDRFTIPGRQSTPFDLQIVNNEPRWKQENTGNRINFFPQYTSSPNPTTYEGPYEYGNFAYWESTENYPNNNIYGNLRNTPIRHHKFPDSQITHIHDDRYIFPLGIKIDIDQINNLINSSNLSIFQKSKIAGFKIVRGNRVVHKSVIARGIIRNVLRYSNTNTPPENTNIINNTVPPIVNIYIQLNRLVSSAKKSDVRDWGNSILNNAYTHLIGQQYDVITSLITAFTISPYPIPDGLLYPTRTPLGNVVDPTYPQRLNDIKSRLTSILNIPVNGQPIPESSYVYVENSIDIINDLIQQYNDAQLGINNPVQAISSFANSKENELYFPNYIFNDTRIRTDANGVPQDNYLFNVTFGDDCKQRFTFHSPDTSFFKPALGSTLNVDSIEYGTTKGRLYQVKNHAGYKIYTDGLYYISIGAAGVISILSRWVVVGLSTGGTIVDGNAAIQTYQIISNILEKCVPFVNYCYQFNSISNLDKTQKFKFKTNIEIGNYLVSGTQNVGDVYNINNWKRESSVYLKTKDAIPDLTGTLLDTSKNMVPRLEPTSIILSKASCYYATIKNEIPNLWGQLYSYESLDTGTYFSIKETGYKNIFGGDCYINPFSFKIKMPFFTDDRVGAPDGADIFYNELSNVGEAKYWYTSRTKAQTRDGFLSKIASTLFGTKDHRLFDSKSQILYRTGKMFLYAYGIPTFYCESTVNVDNRQAFNALEGNYFPNVGNSIPNEWLQEINVPIAFDNTYYYNKTFSKQNKENFFSYLPQDWTFDKCRQYFPFRTIFSEQAKDLTNPSNRNNWLVYKPTSFFDFPQTYGKLTSINSIKNNQVLVRFDNRTLLYNAMYTMPTNALQVYLGQSLFSKNTPPLDFGISEVGYVGSQHRFLLQTEYGPITVDAKRGQIFLLGENAKDISQGISKFLIENLKFSILKQFPNYPIDNVFKGIGITGVYDKRYNRIIITKKDYLPLDKNIKWDGIGFYLETPKAESAVSATNNLDFEIVSNCENGGTINVINVSGGIAPYNWYISGYDNTPRAVGQQINNIPNGEYTIVVQDSSEISSVGIVQITCTKQPPVRNDYLSLEDKQYFCNKSFTISYDLNNGAWISFHSYIPTSYISEQNYFISFYNNKTWNHNSQYIKYNNFYNSIHPYIIEHPYQFQLKDEILQNVTDYSIVLKHDDFESFTESEDEYFNKMILYTNQQCSGNLVLTKKPISNLKSYMEYPKYNNSSKEILYTKVDHLYRINTFWDITKNVKKPIFLKNCDNLSEFKKLNQENMNYNKSSYNRYPIRTKDLKIRMILDNRDDINIQTPLQITNTQSSEI